MIPKVLANRWKYKVLILEVGCGQITEGITKEEIWIKSLSCRLGSGSFTCQDLSYKFCPYSCYMMSELGNMVNYNVENDIHNSLLIKYGLYTVIISKGHNMGMKKGVPSQCRNLINITLARLPRLRSIVVCHYL